MNAKLEYLTERRDWLVVERLRLFRLKRSIDAYACTIDSQLHECVEAGRELGAEVALPIWGKRLEDLASGGNAAGVRRS
jgi:hypothetical protein